MEDKFLSRIERELVLQYLLDGNVPVTVTPFEAEESDEVKPLNSAVVPVAFSAEKISVLREGIILLEDTPEEILKCIDKPVKVEFYFNRVGLYFVTTLKKVSSGTALVIPGEIYHIQDLVATRKYDFTAQLVISVSSEGASSFPCLPAEGFELFSRPAWSSIELESQQRAKTLLEGYVKEAKENGRAGNGLQLINICRYMVIPKIEKIEAVQGRVKPFNILFVNHERIVLGFEKNDAFELSENSEYPLEMSFALKESPAVIRKVFVTCRVSAIYKNEDSTKFSADCIFTTLQEEDCRFLYEKATSTLLI